MVPSASDTDIGLWTGHLVGCQSVLAFAYGSPFELEAIGVVHSGYWVLAVAVSE